MQIASRDSLNVSHITAKLRRSKTFRSEHLALVFRAALLKTLHTWIEGNVQALRVARGVVDLMTALLRPIWQLLMDLQKYFKYLYPGHV